MESAPAPTVATRTSSLALAEIRQIVDLRRAGSAPRVHVRELLRQKATALEATLGRGAEHS